HPRYLRYFSTMRPPPPRPTLFPYTTLFRSYSLAEGDVGAGRFALFNPAAGGERAVAALPGVQPGAAGGGASGAAGGAVAAQHQLDRKSTRLNSSHEWISYAVFCLKKKSKIS